jgi:hypothetical protein
MSIIYMCRRLASSTLFEFAATRDSLPSITAICAATVNAGPCPTSSAPRGQRASSASASSAYESLHTSCAASDSDWSSALHAATIDASPCATSSAARPQTADAATGGRAYESSRTPCAAFSPVSPMIHVEEGLRVL